MCGSFRVKLCKILVDFQVLFFAAPNEVSWGVCLRGVSAWGGLPWGVSAQRAGVSVGDVYQRQSAQGVSAWGCLLGASVLGQTPSPPRKQAKWAVRILLKCIIVLFQVRGWSLEITAGMRKKYGFNTDNINYTDRRDATGTSWLVPMDTYIK